MVKELVVISGKGGTGKTSIVASFASLAKKKVLADCDVDAADLHLILEPRIIRREEFSGGSRARIIADQCTACGKCEEICRYDAIFYDGPGNGKVDKTFRVDPIACEGCGVCAYFCPENTIEFAPAVNGEWFISETRYGPMVHAKLGVAEENSGKLVSIVRTQTKKIAEERKLDLIIIDGSPGIGCPVIASITGADLVLVVTEPTLSGIHDLERISALTRHFDIPTVVCINKYDLNEELSSQIEAKSAELNARVVGKVCYDQAVTKAQIMKSSVVEYTGGLISQQIQSLWRHITYSLG
ncbi:MAG: ATP-binding protein [Gemmatimonadota bacterium]|nr:ATP-binding protein [Gemmatimonadota bacterium]